MMDPFYKVKQHEDYHSLLQSAVNNQKGEDVEKTIEIKESDFNKLVTAIEKLTEAVTKMQYPIISSYPVYTHQYPYYTPTNPFYTTLTSNITTSTC